MHLEQLVKVPLGAKEVPPRVERVRRVAEHHGEALAGFEVVERDDVGLLCGDDG